MRNLLLHLAVFFSGNFWSLFWIFSFHDKKNVTISHYILEYIVHLCNLRQSAVNLTSPCTRSYKSNRNFAHHHFHHSTDCFCFWFSNFFSRYFLWKIHSRFECPPIRIQLKFNFPRIFWKYDDLIPVNWFKIIRFASYEQVDY